MVLVVESTTNHCSGSGCFVDSLSPPTPPPVELTPPGGTPLAQRFRCCHVASHSFNFSFLRKKNKSNDTQQQADTTTTVETVVKRRPPKPNQFLHVKDLSDIMEETESSVEEEDYDFDNDYSCNDFDDDEEENCPFLFHDASASLVEGEYDDDDDDPPSMDDNNEDSATSLTSNTEEEEAELQHLVPSSSTSSASPFVSAAVVEQLWSLMVSLVMFAWLRDRLLLQQHTTTSGSTIPKSRHRSLTKFAHNNNNKSNSPVVTSSNGDRDMDD